MRFAYCYLMVDDHPLLVRLVPGDPFVREGAVATWSLEPWVPTQADAAMTAGGAV